MKTCTLEMTAGRRNIPKAKTQRSIFQGDALSLLPFKNVMMPLNHLLKKCTAGYKLFKSQENINHLMYMDGIKLFAKNVKDLETQIHMVKMYSQDIGMEFGIKNGYTCNEKWQTTSD